VPNWPTEFANPRGAVESPTFRRYARTRLAGTDTVSARCRLRCHGRVPPPARRWLQARWIASGAATVQAVGRRCRLPSPMRCGRAITSNSPELEAVVQCRDPPFGSEGPAPAGVKARLPIVVWQATAISSLSDLRLPRRLRRICLLSPAASGAYAGGGLGGLKQPKISPTRSSYHCGAGSASEDLNAISSRLFSTRHHGVVWSPRDRLGERCLSRR